MVICELIVILIDNFGSLLFFLLPKEGRWYPDRPDSGVEIRKCLLHEGTLSYIMSHIDVDLNELSFFPFLVKIFP